MRQNPPHSYQFGAKFDNGRRCSSFVPPPMRGRVDASGACFPCFLPRLVQALRSPRGSAVHSQAKGKPRPLSLRSPAPKSRVSRRNRRRRRNRHAAKHSHCWPRCSTRRDSSTSSASRYAQYSDAQIGAAARDVLRDCGAVVERMFGPVAVIDQEEGSAVEVAAGFNPKHLPPDWRRRRRTAASRTTRASRLAARTLRTAQLDWQSRRRPDHRPRGSRAEVVTQASRLPLVAELARIPTGEGLRKSARFPRRVCRRASSRFERHSVTPSPGRRCGWLSGRDGLLHGILGHDDQRKSRCPTSSARFGVRGSMRAPRRQTTTRSQHASSFRQSPIRAV